MKFTRKSTAFSQFESQCCLLGKLLKASEHHLNYHKDNHPEQNNTSFIGCVKNFNIVSLILQ